MHDVARQQAITDELDAVGRTRRRILDGEPSLRETRQAGFEMLRTVVIVAAALVAMWLAFVVFVWIIRPDNTSLSDATRLLPDTLRLVRRLSTDRTISRSTRWWIWALLIYLASPIDLVPDFVPIIGSRTMPSSPRSSCDALSPGRALRSFENTGPVAKPG
jgi:hypothetical protein